MSLSETRLGANAPGLPEPTRLPPLPAALSRRAALFGAVTATGFAAAAFTPAESHAAALAAADPFAAYEARIQALCREADALDVDDPASDERHAELLGKHVDIDAAALAGLPATFAGAVGALEYARRELFQFRIEDQDEVEITERLVLHLIDGALDVLRSMVGTGGVA